MLYIQSSCTLKLLHKKNLDEESLTMTEGKKSPEFATVYYCENIVMYEYIWLFRF